MGVKPAAWTADGGKFRDVIAAHGYQIHEEASKELANAEADNLGLGNDDGWLGAASSWLHLSRDGAIVGLKSLVGLQYLGEKYGDVFHASVDATATAHEIALLFPVPN